ncbi:MAG: protein tyrosine phosphatase, partial [Geodermatophilaceae bacterium]|nr:protein tyrosine phosphatase [Geodermatophilaceae bacterium]
MHILFVCTGNICRSPTAERLVQAYSLRHLDDPSQLTASSAGTRAVYGSGVEPNAALVLQSLGGDPTGFVARQVQPEDVTDAHLVLAMTGKHRATVLGASPRALQRSFTLLEARSLLDLVPREELPPA